MRGEERPAGLTGAEPNGGDRLEARAELPQAGPRDQQSPLPQPFEHREGGRAGAVPDQEIAPLEHRFAASLRDPLAASQDHEHTDVLTVGVRQLGQAPLPGARITATVEQGQVAEAAPLDPGIVGGQVLGGGP